MSNDISQTEQKTIDAVCRVLREEGIDLFPRNSTAVVVGIIHAVRNTLRDDTRFLRNALLDLRAKCIGWQAIAEGDHDLVKRDIYQHVIELLSTVLRASVPERKTTELGPLRVEVKFAIEAYLRQKSAEWGRLGDAWEAKNAFEAAEGCRDHARLLQLEADHLAASPEP